MLSEINLEDLQSKEVAYGTMEKISEKLNIEKLLENKEELIDWVDTAFTSKEDFTNLLKLKGVII